MARFRTIPALAAALALAACVGVASPASAQPGAVRISIDSPTQALLSQTITTGATPVTRAGLTCSGSSALGALDVATSGRWDGVPDGAGGLTVTSVFGEPLPTAADPRTYVLVANGLVYKSSLCSLELAPGNTLAYYASSLPAAQIDAGCRTTGRDGYCGSPDRTGPPATITSVKEQARFTSKNAPRRLAGIVSYDPNGLSDVRIRLTRTSGGGRKCHYYAAFDETFLKLPKCGADGPELFSVGSGAKWAYELPRRLTPGRYTLDVQAVDKLGNASIVGARGRDRVVFFVS